MDTLVFPGSVAVRLTGLETWPESDRLLALAKGCAYWVNAEDPSVSSDLPVFPVAWSLRTGSDFSVTHASDSHTEYSLSGAINGVKGVYEIGVDTSSGEPVVTHRFFEPV